MTEPIEFDENTDPTAYVTAALDSANPIATLMDLYPWMQVLTVADFTTNALYLHQLGEHWATADLTVLIQRFAHAVRAEWANQPGRIPAEHKPATRRRWPRLPWTKSGRT